LRREIRISYRRAHGRGASQVDQQAKIDFQLNVGRVTESVEVTVAAPLVESESSTLGQVINEQSVQALPLNGCNFAQLVWLAPGVTTGQVGENLSGSSSYNPPPRRTSTPSAAKPMPTPGWWMASSIMKRLSTP
jgi:hypothetical protein